MVRESRFRNPEFQEKLARARRYERKTGLYFSWRSFIILGLFLTAVYFLAISKKFLVTQAAVSGTGASAEEISAVLTRMRNERFGYVIPRNHILILDEEKLLFEIQQEFPAVRSISALKKIWPDQIAVAIEERVPKYVWQSGSDFFLCAGNLFPGSDHRYLSRARDRRRRPKYKADFRICKQSQGCLANSYQSGRASTFFRSRRKKPGYFGENHNRFQCTFRSRARSCRTAREPQDPIEPGDIAGDPWRTFLYRLALASHGVLLL